MTTADLERAIASTAAVMATLTPDQLDASSPCASWKVRDIVNHVVGGAYMFAAVASTGTPDEAAMAKDYASGDYQAAYAEGAAQAIAGFQTDGAMQRSMSLGFADMPGEFVMGIATTDTFQHGWDLARSIGASTDLDPELAAQLLERSRGFIGDQMRGEDGKAFFGPRVDVPDSAPAADQLAGFLGRQI
jgi:uncharacterized protein (TIGR03086 family)